MHNERSHRQLVVINVVGLTPAMIGDHTPCIAEVARRGFQRPLKTVLPAVTCTVQATMLTGKMPSEHGIVANGWYHRDLAEVMFWKQSNALIEQPCVYRTAAERDPSHSTAKMFWWFNMYSGAALSVTPRPSYPADGRKIPDIYSEPPDLRDALQNQLGRFPLFNFWGPTADIRSTSWIADASVRVFEEHRPSLMLVYLPHLDYNLQRLGPNDASVENDIRLVDAEVGKLVAAADQAGAEVIILSEYGITEVSRPIHINRTLREAGFLRTRTEPTGWETLDAGASRAFAVADHQLAHIYVRDPGDTAQVEQLIGRLEGVERVFRPESEPEFGTAHSRSGELIAVSSRESWFTYYFWLDDARAPDYARTVDIHRKPGYDPVELFVDPEIRLPKFRVASRLARKVLGFRYYMDVIGLNAEIVKGSHGRLPDAHLADSDGPVLICSDRSAERDAFHAADIRDLILSLQFGS